MYNIEEQFNKQVHTYKESKLYYFEKYDPVGKKVEAIAQKLNDSNIKDVVIGISGGIDSAVVLGLLTQVKQQYIPDLKIHGYCITFGSVYGGIFKRIFVDMLIQQFCNEDVTIDVLDCSYTLKAMISQLRIEPTEQLLAQSSYALRYQMFFTYAQLHNAVTIGTTNRDEFEYVGWFGKHSDMVVDFQVITNWHKFEVVEAAKQLGVPDEIINRAPTGDLINDTSDEDNFGCTYDELAYFSTLRSMVDIQPIRDFYLTKYSKVLALHEKNIHKYQGQTFNPIFIK